MCLLYISCNSQIKKTESKIVIIDSNQNLIDSAKSLLLQSNEFVKKGIKGELSNKKVNKITKPLMDKYFLVFKKINPSDTFALNEYRIRLINELVDLQLKIHP